MSKNEVVSLVISSAAIVVVFCAFGLLSAESVGVAWGTPGMGPHFNFALVTGIFLAAINVIARVIK